jgi:large subunit ribosomal protein L3
MKFIIGKKISMSQQFTADGSVVPVTLVAVGPCTVTQVRTKDVDGYTAVQVGYGMSRNLAKPQKMHLKELPMFATLREFRTKEAADVARGQVITALAFAVGDVVEVEGVSKGRGFQGVVKRHGFHGHPTSHGHKDQTRMPGSIGSKRQGPVAPGKRMAGRMGGDQVTVKNLEVVSIDAEKNILAIKGAIPGARGGLVLISGPGVMELHTPQSATLEATPDVAVAPIDEVTPSVREPVTAEV